MSAPRPPRVLVAAAVLSLATACDGPAPGQAAGVSSLQAAVAQARSSPYTWMISVRALGLLAKAGLPGPLLQAYFDRPSTVLLGAGPRPDPLASRASAAAGFTDVVALVRALDQGQVPRPVRYVVLDLEDWALTPPDQRRHPVSAASDGLVAARSVGKQLIFTPAADLVRAMLGHRLGPGQLSAEYDRLLAGPGAQASSVLEVQAQSSEGTPAATSFAAAALAAARRSRPGATVLVGLSTNPGGRRVSPADLLQVVRSVPSASGFWLNVPQAGRACPRCGQAQPQVAVAFLEELAGMSPG